MYILYSQILTYNSSLVTASVVHLSKTPRLLPGSGPAEIRTRDLLDRERTLYR